MDSFIWQVQADDDLAAAFRGAGDAFGNAIKATIGPFSGMIGNLLSGKYLGMVLELQAKFQQFGLTMGKTVTEVRNLQGVMYKVGQNLGISTDMAEKLVKTLVSGRAATKDIQALATHMGMFSEVTGTSVESTSELVTNFLKMKGTSTTTAMSMLTNLAQIQKGLGLTQQGMEAVVRSSSKLVTNIAAMGAGSAQVNKMVSAVANLAATFEKAGMSAGEATGWIERIFSAEGFEQNLVMMQKLGISASDYAGILAGTVPMQDKINDRLASLGGEIKEMMKNSPIAAKAYASIWGGELTAEQLIRINAAKKEGQKSDEAMKQMWGVTTGTISKRISQLQNTFDNFLQGFMYSIVPAIEPLIFGLIDWVKRVDWNAFGRWLKVKLFELIDVFKNLQTGNLPAGIAKALAGLIGKVFQIAGEAFVKIWDKSPTWLKLLVIGAGIYKALVTLIPIIQGIRMANAISSLASGGTTAGGGAIAGLLPVLWPILLAVGIVAITAIASKVLDSIFGPDAIKTNIENSRSRFQQGQEALKGNTQALNALTNIERARLFEEYKKSDNFWNKWKGTTIFSTSTEKLLAGFNLGHDKIKSTQDMETALTTLEKTGRIRDLIKGIGETMNEKEINKLRIQNLLNMPNTKEAFEKNRKELKDLGMENLIGQAGNPLLDPYKTMNRQLDVITQEENTLNLISGWLETMGYEMEKRKSGLDDGGVKSREKAEAAIWGEKKGELVIKQKEISMEMSKQEMLSEITKAVKWLAGLKNPSFRGTRTEKADES